MKLYATFGSEEDYSDKYPFKEIRLDVFSTLPKMDENTILTLCDSDFSNTENFEGYVDVGDRKISKNKMIRSFHNYEKTPTCEEIIDQLSVDCEISKGAYFVSSFNDLNNIFNASQTIKKRHTILGMGELGTITRIRSKLLKNEFTFGYVGKPTAPGQLSYDDMKKMNENTVVVGIIGDNLAHSLSPKIHNAAINDLGLNGMYLKFSLNSLEGFKEFILNYNIKGVNVTIPYKEKIIDFVDEVDDTAKKIGAINTIINYNKKLIGTNTDVKGIEYAFNKKNIDINSLNNVLILGSGGAAKSAAFVFASKCSKTYVLGRNIKTVDDICKKFSVSKYNDEKVDVIVNCTPIGMREDTNYPIDLNIVDKDTIVFDMVYNRETELVKCAKKRNSIVVDGKDMLIGQAKESFKCWFSQYPNDNIMEENI